MDWSYDLCLRNCLHQAERLLLSMSPRSGSTLRLQSLRKRLTYIPQTSVPTTTAVPPPPPSSTVSPPASTPTASGGLNSIAKAHGLTYFGSATDNGELSDQPYVAILSDNTMFGQITPANSMKWVQSYPLIEKE